MAQTQTPARLYVRHEVATLVSGYTKLPMYQEWTQWKNGTVGGN